MGPLLEASVSRGLCAVFALLVAALSVAFTDGAADVRDSPSPKNEKAVPLRLPPDIVFDKAKDAPASVVFSHASHVALEQNCCLACHPQPFKMLHPSHRATHAEMDAKASCGSCHDGKKAFATTDAERCDGCHRGEEARP